MSLGLRRLRPGLYQTNDGLVSIRRVSYEVVSGRTIDRWRVSRRATREAAWTTDGQLHLTLTSARRGSGR